MASPQRGRWILAIVVGLVFCAAGSYALVRAQRFADRSRWRPVRGTVATEGLAMRDGGSYELIWTDRLGRMHTGRVETSADAARAMVEQHGGEEIDARVLAIDGADHVCPVEGFDTCVATARDLKGVLLAFGAGLALIGYAVYRLVRRPR